MRNEKNIIEEYYEKTLYQSNIKKAEYLPCWFLQLLVHSVVWCHKDY